MPDTSKLVKRSGLFAVATSIAFQLLMIAAIVLRPEIDPARKPISEYAIGRLGGRRLAAAVDVPHLHSVDSRYRDQICRVVSTASARPQRRNDHQQVSPTHRIKITHSAPLTWTPHQLQLRHSPSS
jgi:hypothetical protein